VNGEILIVTESLPPIYGGADIAAYRYFKYLKEAGNPIWLIGNRNSSAIKEEHIVMVRQLPMPNFLKRFGSYYLRFVYLFSQVFFFLIRHPRIKMIHAFNSATLIVQVSILAGRLLGRKVIIETSLKGSDDPLTILSKSGGWLHQWASGKVMLRKLYSLANGYIAKSHYLRGLFNQSELASKPVYVVPYFVDTQLYYKATTHQKELLRSQLNLPSDKFIICFVGGINPRKGVDLLLKAFVALHAKHGNLFLVLVGPMAKYNQEFVNTIKQGIVQMGPEVARLVGQVQNSHQWMMASDVYVLPSLREGFPISILEALCCGLLVIGSDISEINPEQIQNEVNGLLFEAGSAPDLERQIERALTKPATWLHDLAEVAAQKYDIKQVAKHYSKIYEAIS
jgi:glycosyltransferase involved in cell wall biosynthesis